MVFVYLYGHIVCVALEVARKGLASGKISADRFHANRPLLRSVSRRGASSQYASCPGKGGCTEASIYKDKFDCMGNVDAECRSGNRPFPTGGKWRIQDRDGNTPAWGGGISAGYRMPFCRNGRFCMEFSLGAGVYKVSYDKFANERQGAYHSTVRKTFIGLDQLGVSVSYCLNRQ